MRHSSFSFSAVAAVFAMSVFASSVPAHASVDEASKYVESLGSRAIEVISNKTLSKEKKADKIEKLFRENVDIPWVGRFVLGRFWRQTTDDQKTRYLKEYESFLVGHYASRFSEYSGGSFKVTSARDDGDNEYTVSMQIQSAEANSQPVLVDYRVHAADKKSYKVFDVIVEGVSMITTQRSEFSSVVGNKGVDYLITQLANKAIDIPEGQPAKN